MLILSLYALITFGLGQVASYEVDIHPEYQEGLSINDVPADRRLHWMRVANEVSPRPFEATMLKYIGCLCERSSMPTSSIRLGDSQHYIRRADMCYCKRCWHDRRCVETGSPD